MLSSEAVPTAVPLVPTIPPPFPSDGLVFTPYYNKYLNLYLAWTSGTFFFGALTLVIHVHGPEKWYDRDTIAIIAGSPLFGLAFAALKFRFVRLDERIGARCAGDSAHS